LALDVRASKPFDSTVHFNMLVEVSALCEAEATVWEGAYVGALICMNAKVIEKVVPFTEPLRAIFVVTLQNLDVAL